MSIIRPGVHTTISVPRLSSVICREINHKVSLALFWLLVLSFGGTNTWTYIARPDLCRPLSQNTRLASLCNFFVRTTLTCSRMQVMHERRRHRAPGWRRRSRRRRRCS